MKKTFFVSKIVWDTTDDKHLPKKFNIDLELDEDDFNDDEYVSDCLIDLVTDIYGEYHHGFLYEEV